MTALDSENSGQSASSPILQPFEEYDHEGLSIVEEIPAWIICICGNNPPFNTNQDVAETMHLCIPCCASIEGTLKSDMPDRDLFEHCMSVLRDDDESEHVPPSSLGGLPDLSYDSELSENSTPTLQIPSFSTERFLIDEDGLTPTATGGQPTPVAWKMNLNQPIGPSFQNVDFTHNDISDCRSNITARSLESFEATSVEGDHGPGFYDVDRIYPTGHGQEAGRNTVGLDCFLDQELDFDNESNGPYEADWEEGNKVDRSADHVTCKHKVTKNRIRLSKPRASIACGITPHGLATGVSQTSKNINVTPDLAREQLLKVEETDWRRLVNIVNQPKEEITPSPAETISTRRASSQDTAAISNKDNMAEYIISSISQWAKPDEPHLLFMGEFPFGRTWVAFRSSYDNAMNRWDGTKQERRETSLTSQQEMDLVRQLESLLATKPFDNQNRESEAMEVPPGSPVSMSIQLEASNKFHPAFSSTSSSRSSVAEYTTINDTISAFITSILSATSSISPSGRFECGPRKVRFPLVNGMTDRHKPVPPMTRLHPTSPICYFVPEPTTALPEHMSAFFRTCDLLADQVESKLEIDVLRYIIDRRILLAAQT